MPSLLEQLPKIVADGKREAEQILDRLESGYRIGLQTRELVIPSKDTATKGLYQGQNESDLAFGKMSRLIYGDNLLAMAALLAGDEQTPSMRGKIDLIYIDPPFDSKADYRSKIAILSEAVEQRPSAIEQFAYSDTWENGTASYLAMLCPRLFLMKQFLSSKGSLFVHIDYHVGHYVKVLLDEVFGKGNLRNEIIWCYHGPGSPGMRQYNRKHDTIYWYSNDTDAWVFNDQDIREAHNEKTRENFRAGLAGSGFIADTYELEEGGKIPEDWWVMAIAGRYPIDGIKRVGYATEKPWPLIERIVKTASQKGSIVADFFCGSGIVAAVAESLDREWIAVDLGKPANMVARKRLVGLEAKPFLFQSVGDYQVEQMRSTLGRRFKIGDLSQIVIGLYGALPLAPADNPNRNLGRVGTAKHLVYVDSPNKMTGLATLKKAIALRETHMGGWDKVIVLGWNFEPSIGHDIDGLNDDNLEVLVIPPDLLDRLKKKGKKLKADEVRFSSLQYLVLGDVERKRTTVGESLSVELENYVLLSPEALNLDEANRKKLEKIVEKEPLALVEYWSIDPDYDGEVFRSVWQDYRGNTDNNNDPYRVVTRALLGDLPVKDGPRKVCVRAVDVFGFEAEAVVEVN